MTLEQLGWNDRLEQGFADHRTECREPARVLREDRELYLVSNGTATLAATVSGRFRHEAQAPADFPAAGDWVAIDARVDEGAATIHAVLPRTSVLSRKAAGRITEEQVVAANVDTVFVVCGLDGDFNLRRIERYLTAVFDGGSSPVVVLNKADLCPGDLEERLAETRAVALGAPVIALSALEGQGLDALAPWLLPGRTVVLVGSSGTGKSTLVNTLAGEALQKTTAVRPDDSRGRHTTTRRELIVLPGGALLLDTPGMRLLGLWGGEASIETTFADVEGLARGCRFRDCAHEGEPGCVVQQALDSGELPEDRYHGWRKLERETAAFAARHDKRLAAEQKARWKGIHKALRSRPPKGYRG